MRTTLQRSAEGSIAAAAEAARADLPAPALGADLTSVPLGMAPNHVPPLQRAISFDGGDPVLGVPASKFTIDDEIVEQLFARSIALLEGTGGMDTGAALHFTRLILGKETVDVSRGVDGTITGDAALKGADYKAVFELYRQRYRLADALRTWTESLTIRPDRLTEGLLDKVRENGGKTFIADINRIGDEQLAYAAVGQAVEYLLTRGQDLAEALHTHLHQDIRHVRFASTRRLLEPLWLRYQPQRILTTLAHEAGGPETMRDYGTHHGVSYQLGLTSIGNYLADTFIEGYDRDVTDFSTVTIRGPRPGGKPLATGSQGGVLADGWYMYIVDAQMQMRYYPTHNYIRENKSERAKIFSQYIPHTVLSGGAQVWAAGTFLIRDGEFALVDNGSGHYRPLPASLQVVRGVLAGMGYRTGGTEFVEFENTIPVGTEKGILPNLDGIEIGTVGKKNLTMERPPMTPEVADLRRRIDTGNQ